MPSPVVDACASVVRAARTGAHGAAAASLATLMAELGSLARSGALPTAKLESLTGALRTIAVLQTWQDWVAIADIVEHELAPLVAAG